MSTIPTEYQKGNFRLKNHAVMAPMTRSRAIGNIPNDLMATYYAQRAGAGLIVTEGTSPAPEGLGYARIPGIFSEEQTEAWKKVTSAVHEKNSKIFLQIMHTGRIGHGNNLPEGVSVVGVSDVKAAGQMWTDQGGMLEHPQPVALSESEVEEVIDQYVNAAENAIKAGFDGVELHGANGYLLEQFLNPHVNTRTDKFGGSIEKRAKAVLDIAEKIAASIGKEKVGIRFSPNNTYNDMTAYPDEEVRETYGYLAQKLNEIGITYLHIAQNPDIKKETFDAIRSNFDGTIILCNGLTPASAEEALHAGFADLVAFGTSFLGSPDLIKRIETGAELNALDFDTFYTPGPIGYIDYPIL
ncbi:alkene reductase [Dyadobacter sp. CY323]|uniref:alkene reductase n=1 Tax=Dyadobacter sp. CY323 TaxID=2907302 RepID=UPI001F2DE3A8|nr:alkene reductase [Dyadobacter sp. CY323]MCE6988026.1 alkene reductase [Dyadobacter sp. CY323]